MKEKLSILLAHKNESFLCPNCQNHNVHPARYVKCGDSVKCEICQSEFILKQTTGINTYYKVDCINVEERLINVKTVLTWDCPFCKTKNEHYEIRLGDVLRCPRCGKEVMLTELAKKVNDEHSKFKFKHVNKE
jgi:ribosomal protein L44E